LISQLTTPGNTVFLAMPVDWRVLAFLAAIAVATALLFGTAPALGATRVQPTHGLHLRSRTPGSSSGRLSGAFVVAQVALSLVLVVGAGLLVRSFVALSGRPLGFDPDAIMTVTLSARPSQTTKDPAAVRVRRILDAVQATPGVAAAAFGQLIPTSGSSTATWFENPDGRSLSQSERQVSTNRVSPGWFATMGTRVLAGRDFEWSDTADAETRIVINDSLVRTFFPDVNPVGQTLREVGRPNHVMPALTVIGVVEDAVYVSARDGTPPTMYRLLPAASHLMVRAAKGPGGALKNSIAGAIARTDPDFLMTFRPLSEHVRATLARERILATLSGFFGALALLVAALGVYGVMASAVTRQRAEIGLRRALGATERNIFGLVVKRGMRLVGLGVTIGAVISLWAAGTLQTLLFSVSPRDPIAIAGAASVLVTVSFTAIWLPSRRASRLDPAIALREE
jgi:predicted permease